MLSEPPKSCDTLVALPPATANGCVVFGKNSDRPGQEVQEVIYQAAAEHEPGTKLQVCHFFLMYTLSLVLLNTDIYSVYFSQGIWGIPYDIQKVPPILRRGKY